MILLMHQHENEKPTASLSSLVIVKSAPINAPSSVASKTILNELIIPLCTNTESPLSTKYGCLNSV